MKLQNKILLIILLQFLSLLNSHAQNDINKLFFNLPLESSRDTIYSSIKKFGFIEKISNRTISQNDKVIKTFYGYLDIKNNTADSIKIQLSTGSSSIETKNITKIYSLFGPIIIFRMLKLLKNSITLKKMK